MQRFVQLRRVEPDLYRVEAVFFSTRGSVLHAESSEDVISIEAPVGKKTEDLAHLLYRSGEWITPESEDEPSAPEIEEIQVLDPDPLLCDPPPVEGAPAPPWADLPPIDRIRAWTASWKCPKISILIPSKDKLDLLTPCLLSLERTTRGYPVEVLIGDTASAPKTIRFYNEAGLSVVRFATPFNFARVCNSLAGAAQGEYLLFLNNDTEALTDGWPGMLMQRSPEGITGAVLVYPGKKKIQHAGLEIRRHADGHIYSEHTGHNQEIEEIDKLDLKSAIAETGAFLFMHRKTFNRLGGFDVAFRLDLNDADLCIRARQIGIPVSVCKEVVFLHHESASRKGAWVHPTREWKLITGRFGQAIDEWQKTRAVSFRKDAGRVLIVDDYIPDPANGLHYPRARGLLDCLRSLNYRVTLFPMASREARQPWTDILLKSGVEVITEDVTFSEFSRERYGFYDTVIVSRPHNFQKINGLVRANFPNARVIYDSEALFFVREELRAKVLGLNPKKAEEEGKVELELMSRADRVICVSDEEKRIAEQRRPDLIGRVTVSGHMIEPTPTMKKFEERAGLLFLGNLSEGNPNEDAIVWFTREVYPKIQRRLGCTLAIVGSCPTQRVRDLESDTIRVTGFVSDKEKVRYYDAHRVFVVPHRFAAGIPWKLHEAMGYGIPSVVTSLIAGQLRMTGEEAVIARTPDDLVDRVIRLYTDPELWTSIRDGAFRLLRKTCSRQVMIDTMKKLLESGR